MIQKTVFLYMLALSHLSKFVLYSQLLLIINQPGFIFFPCRNTSEVPPWPLYSIAFQQYSVGGSIMAWATIA